MIELELFRLEHGTRKELTFDEENQVKLTLLEFLCKTFPEYEFELTSTIQPQEA